MYSPLGHWSLYRRRRRRRGRWLDRCVCCCIHFVSQTNEVNQSLPERYLEEPTMIRLCTMREIGLGFCIPVNSIFNISIWFTTVITSVT